MGAWGYYPKDSDGALDFFGDIGGKINEELTRITDDFENLRYSEYNYAGLIMLLLQKGFFIPVKFVEKAKTCIANQLAKTELNEANWSNQEEAVETMKYLVSEFTGLLAEKKEHYTNDSNWDDDGKSLPLEIRMQKYMDSRVLAPKGWLLRDHEIKAGSSWSGLIEMCEKQDKDDSSGEI